MRLLHTATAVEARFDDENLISHAGLEPVMRLAEQCGLHQQVRASVRLPDSVGSNPAGKVATVVAGMLAGADSIDDLDLVRHGGMRRLFGEVYAPSTVGSFLRGFTHGHVRQLQAAARQFLIKLVDNGPVLAGADQLTFVDIDSMLRPVYGKKKQGAAFGHAKIGSYQVRLRGYNPLLATVSTADAGPVVVASRLRAGNAGSARGGAAMTAEAIGTAKACGATGEIIVRADSAFYSRKVIWAARRHQARFSITTRMDNKIRTTIESGIAETQWVDIRYPHAIFDEQEQRWISDAQIAETSYTAFAGTRHEITARLIVRRVRRINPRQPTGQGELFPIWRYHAVFTDSPFILVQAEAQHRGHAIIEQVNADLIDGPLAHLPSGHFAANGAWLTCAVIAYNLTRTAGHLAGCRHGRARGATIRREIINVAGRLAHSARKITIHLPDRWPWQHSFADLFTTVHARAAPA